MYNLLISLVVGVIVALLIRLAQFPLLAGIIPGVIAFVGTYVVLARRVATRIGALSTAAQKDLSTPSTNKREQQARVEKAIKTLEEGLKYDKWQFMVASEIHAQIGMIKYMIKDLDGAEPHLAKANARNFMAKAMQGALFFQKKDYARMKESFEAAVKSGKKESIVWAVYAWCLIQLKDKDGAQQVLARGVEASPSDEKLKNALTSLQNDKRMKMRAWEPMWWQFGLELPPMPVVGGGGGGRRVQYVRR